MTNLINALNELHKQVKSGNVTVKSHKSDLKKIDTEMIETLAALDYHYDKEKHDKMFYTFDPEQQHVDAKEKKELFEHIPEVAFPDFIRYGSEKLEKFLHQLGFPKYSYIKYEPNLFKVEIRIHYSKGVREDGSDLLNTLCALEHNGIEFKNKQGTRNSYYIPDTNENRSTIEDLLTKYSFRGIRFESFQNKIDKIKCCMNVKNLYNIEIAQEEPDNNKKSNDELAHLLKDVILALKCLEDDTSKSEEMISSCGFVAESSFSEFCESIGFKGKVTKEIEDLFAESRKRNIETHEISNDLGSKFAERKEPKEVAEISEKFFAALQKYAYENLNSSVQNQELDCYGNLTATLVWQSHTDDIEFLEEALELDDVKFEAKTVDERTDGLDVIKYDNVVHLKNNEINLKTLEARLSSIGMELMSVNVEKRFSGNDNVFVIKQMEVSSTSPYKIAMMII